MFGAIASGRLVQTDFQQIDETKFLVNIADADNINYLVIFLTGATPLPHGTAAGVYFSWPDPHSPPKFQYLGFISNTKPSAMFKISSLKKLHEMEETGDMFGSSQISHIAQIGISIESDASIAQQTPANNDADSYYNFATKILENFVNFASSYTVTQSQMTPNPSETYVPLSTLMNWFTNFQRRLQQNPNFWR